MLRVAPLFALALGLAGCWIIDDFELPPDTSHVYVVSLLSVPEIVRDDPGSRLAVGMDLDVAASDGSGLECTDAEDFRSPITAAGGVDNQLAARFVPWFRDDFGPEGLDGQLRDRITSGELVVVLDVVIGSLHDDDGHVAVHLGSIAGMPRIEAGRLAPDQEVVLGADLGTHDVSLRGGLFEIVVAEIPLALTIADRTFVLTLRDVHIAGDITEDALINAEMGGHVELEELLPLDAVVECPDASCPTEPTIFDVVQADLDLRADATPGRSPECDAVSFGFAFEAVSAVVADGP